MYMHIHNLNIRESHLWRQSSLPSIAKVENMCTIFAVDFFASLLVSMFYMYVCVQFFVCGGTVYGNNYSV